MAAFQIECCLMSGGVVTHPRACFVMMHKGEEMKNYTAQDVSEHMQRHAMMNQWMARMNIQGNAAFDWEFKAIGEHPPTFVKADCRLTLPTGSVVRCQL